MKISVDWLKDFISTDDSYSDIADILTMLGLEAEDSLETNGLDDIIIGEVRDRIKHPNADRLNLCKVFNGEKILPIVCGAPNVDKGQKIAFAPVGAILPGDFKINKAKIRGEVSEGMICAEDELGLGTSHEGIMVLNKKLKPGTPAAEVFDIETDHVFEIGLTPNRADAMSHYGVARDFRAGLIQHGINLELITPSVSDFHVDERRLRFDIEVENKEKEGPIQYR